MIPIPVHILHMLHTEENVFVYSISTQQNFAYNTATRIMVARIQTWQSTKIPRLLDDRRIFEEKPA